MGQLEESGMARKYLSDRPEIKSLDDYKVVLMNEYLKTILKGMQLAGLS